MVTRFPGFANRAFAAMLRARRDVPLPVAGRERRRQGHRSRCRSLGGLIRVQALARADHRPAAVDPLTARVVPDDSRRSLRRLASSSRWGSERAS